MNKKELSATLLAKSSDVTTAKAATAIVDTIFDTIKSELASGSSVAIAGFGNFTPALQKGKSGKVPGTDKIYTTTDRMVPRFKAAKALKDSVAAGK